MATEVTELTIGVHEGDILDGRYRIERKLGGGGMGVVWAAQHILLNTRVAIKFPQAEILQDPVAVRRFIQEARAAANIRSEHVARVLDVAILGNGIPFQVIEYLEGGDLRARLRQKGRLDISEAVDFMLQTCEAIAQAHAVGIIHRDLKPENLFCTGEDVHRCIKVLDFGISKVLQESALNNDTSLESAMTRAGTLLGSPQYMSPEHLQSAREVDARTDIWSLGVILFELLTGRLPFRGDTLPELSINIATEPTPNIRGMRAEVPEELRAVIERCLEKRRERRYDDVASLAQVLRPFAPATNGEQLQRPMPVANSQNDSCATLVPYASAEQMSLKKDSPTVATWEQSASVRPRWTRILPWSIAALAGLSVAALLGFRILSTRIDHRQPTAASSGSAVSEPLRLGVTSAPGWIPENIAFAPEMTAAAVQLADGGAIASRRTLARQGSPASPVPVMQPAKRASVAARRQGNCNPNYDLDADGQKHYKPECF